MGNNTLLNTPGYQINIYFLKRKKLLDLGKIVPSESQTDWEQNSHKNIKFEKFLIFYLAYLTYSLLLLFSSFSNCIVIATIVAFSVQLPLFDVLYILYFV